MSISSKALSSATQAGTIDVEEYSPDGTARNWTGVFGFGHHERARTAARNSNLLAGR